MRACVATTSATVLLQEVCVHECQLSGLQYSIVK